MKIQEWNEAYHCFSDFADKDILFIRKLKQAKFRDSEIEDILTIIDSVCRHCWDNEYGCQCWNDD